MDQEYSQVKKETEDQLLTLALLEENNQQEQERSVQEQQEPQHVVLALSSEHPKKPRVTFTMSKQTENMEMSVKKRRSCSKFNHVAYHLAGNCTGCKQTKARLDGSIQPTVFKSPAMVRAEQLLSSLGSAFPSFMKCLVRSHVSSCFWMGLPGRFCKTHLPKKDCPLILEDEDGKQFVLKYLAHKTGLSGGWRPFSTSHKLLEGDVLVFQLVEPTKFKLYIVRSSDVAKVDGALEQLNMVPYKQNDADKTGTSMVTPKYLKKKRPRSLLLSAVHKKKNKKIGTPRLASNIVRPVEQCGNDSEEVRSEVLQSFKLSQRSLYFTDAESLESFRIIVNGNRIDPELSEDARKKYYELCRSQKAFLHENFVSSSNFKLIIGAINETVKIADAIKACKFTTSRDEYGTWDRTLQGLELLGMTVGFLRTRILRLVEIAYGSEDATETRKYLAAKARQNEIRDLETRLLKLKEDSGESCANIEGLKSKARNYRLKFQEEVLAPWWR